MQISNMKSLLYLEHENPLILQRVFSKPKLHLTQNFLITFQLQVFTQLKLDPKKHHNKLIRLTFSEFDNTSDDLLK